MAVLQSIDRGRDRSSFKGWFKVGNIVVAGQVEKCLLLRKPIDICKYPSYI